MLNFEHKKIVHSKEQLYMEYNILENSWVLNLSLLISITGPQDCVTIYPLFCFNLTILFLREFEK